MRRPTLLVLSVLLISTLHSAAFVAEADKVAQIFNTSISKADIEPEKSAVELYRTNYPGVKKRSIIATLRHRNLSSKIWERIYQKIADENHLQPTDEEMAIYNTFKSQFGRQSAETELTEEEVESLVSIDIDFVRLYKINKFLYEKYGGKVIFQQGNPQEPVGAYRQLLEDYEKRGLLQILDEDYRNKFWAYFISEHNIEIPPENVDFSKPWWQKIMENTPG